MKVRLLQFLNVGVLAVFALVMTGCTTPSGDPDRTATGALVGGASGTFLGAMLSRGHPAGALLGGAAGLVAGGLVGHSMDQEARRPAYVYSAPPPVVAAPAPRYVWVDPQWVWNGREWVWSDGHWQLVP